MKAYNKGGACTSYHAAVSCRASSWVALTFTRLLGWFAALFRQVLSWVYTPNFALLEQVRSAQDREFWELQIQLEDWSQICPRSWYHMPEPGIRGLPPVVAGSYLFQANYWVARCGLPGGTKQLGEAPVSPS